MISAPTTLVHGVFMHVFGIGTLITGESGTGKSAIALALLHRGHQLIADDAPEFTRINSEILLGKSPAALLDLLEIRGVGVVNIRQLLGAKAVLEAEKLSLIIHLERKTVLPRNANAPVEDHQIILETPIRRFHIAFTEHYGAELLIETIVRYSLTTTPLRSACTAHEATSFSLGTTP